MKRLLAALLIVSAGTASARHRLETGPLDPSPWADTEATTNLFFEIGESEMRNVVFSLDFEATPSNNVEVAFGKDVDGNGTLTPEEQEMTAGWDCGKWFVAGRSGLRTAPWGTGVFGLRCRPSRPRRTRCSLGRDWSLPGR